MSAEQEIIKGRAYQLWQDAGSPDGRDQEFWYQAEAEVKGGKAAPKPKAAKAPAKAAAKPAAKATPAKAKAAPKAKAAAKV